MEKKIRQTGLNFLWNSYYSTEIGKKIHTQVENIYTPPLTFNLYLDPIVSAPVFDTGLFTILGSLGMCFFFLDWLGFLK